MMTYYCEPVKDKIRIHWDGYNCVVREFREGIVTKGPYKGKPFSGWYFFGYWPNLDWFVGDCKMWQSNILTCRKEAKRKDCSEAAKKNLEYFEERHPVFKACFEAFNASSLDKKTELIAMKADPEGREFTEEHKAKIAAVARSRKGKKLGPRKE